jgi:hypothetical protein
MILAQVNFHPLRVYRHPRHGEDPKDQRDSGQEKRQPVEATANPLRCGHEVPLQRKVTLALKHASDGLTEAGGGMGGATRFQTLLEV